MELIINKDSEVLSDNKGFQEDVVIGKDGSFSSVYVFNDVITESQSFDMANQINATLDEDWMFQVSAFNRLSEDIQHYGLIFVWRFQEEHIKRPVDIAARTIVFNKSVDECLEVLPESISLRRLDGDELRNWLDAFSLKC